MNDRRNLPQDVITRLADVDVETDQFCISLRGSIYEARPTTGLEIRLDEDGNPVFEGYATTYEVEYDVYGGPERGGWTEIIAEGAADKSVRERDDVRLLVNHDSYTAVGVALARTKSKTLTLTSDKIGLRCDSVLDPKSPVVQILVSAMERKDLDEMSFAFRAMRQEWDDDFKYRRILETQVRDVSAVVYPANPTAVAQLRNEAPETGMSLDHAKAIAAAL